MLLVLTIPPVAAAPKTIVAAVPRYFPPIYDIDSQGRAVGFGIDVMNALARRAGLSIRYDTYETWNEANMALLSGKADLVPNSGVTPARAKDRLFTRPIHHFDIRFFVRSDSPIASMADLRGRRIGIAGINAARDRLAAMDRYTVTDFADYPATLLALLRGRIDAMVFPAPIVWRLAGESGIADQLREVGDPILSVERAVAVRRGRGDLVAALNDAIGEFVGTPEFETIYRRWHDWERPILTVSRIAWGAAAVIVLIIALAVYWRFDSLRRSERLRRRSEARFRALFDYAPYAINIKDRSGKIIRLNPEMRRWHGLADDASGNITITDVVLGDLGKWISGKDREVFESGKACSYQQIVTRVDGTTFPALILKFPILDDTGEVSLVGTLAADISERVAVEEALRDRESQLRAIMDNTPAAISLKGSDGRFREANRGTLARYGLSAEAFVGKTSDDIDSPDILREVEAQEKLVRESATAQTFEVERVVDGKECTLMIVRFPVHDERTGDTGIGSIHFDITDRKRAEAALRESEAHLRAIMDNAPVAVFLKDRNGKLLAANPTHLTRRMANSENVFGKTTHQYNGPDVAAEIEDQERQVMETGQPMTFEVVRDLPEGENRILMVIRFPIMVDENEVIGVGGISLDMTERVTMERQLIQAQKMEVVGQLTGGIAHDFNNLLQIIETNLELARDAMRAEKPATAFVDAALNAGHRGATLTQQLLAFSRKQTLRPRRVRASVLIEGLRKLLSRTLGEDIAIVVTSDDDTRPMLVDENGLTNALLNLAVNARAAMPHGGSLTIAARNRTLKRHDPSDREALPPGEYVEIAVTDTGMGMSKETAKRAFEPFFTTKGVGEGSGLGLSMVYGFARQSGGDVAIDSTPGSGTTVRILLPSDSTEPPPSDRAERNLGIVSLDLAILLVEDDADVRLATGGLLSALGCTLVEAEDAVSALDILDRRSDIDLLLTDIVLPGGHNGIELARDATTRHPNLRVLLVSGYPEAALEKAGLQAVGFRLLGKPFSREALFEALREITAE